MYEIRSTSYNCSGLKKMLKNLNPLDQRALDYCLKLFEDTSVELKATIDDLSIKSTIGSKRHHDLQTLLSGAMTNLYTYLDGFAYSKGRVGDRIEKKLLQISHHVSNSLAMLNKVPGVEKLTTSSDSDEFNLVVAKDGTGNFTTIGEALSVAPNSSTTRFVIHVTAGAYFENVEVIRKKTNLMFVGDGIGKTVVKGSRNVEDGWTIFQSATVAVVGAGFIAKGITFENFVGYQDTLYVHSLRQFYRERDIYGTVDFIFGNAAVVFQNCNLYARKPNENQKNLFMAQGREDPNQNTGISILNCKIAAAADLIPVKSSFKSYLGRPWKMYSMTVVLKSYVDIDPAGWLEWNETFALDTLYYGEYMNRGPCSNTSGRVTWPGYRVINSSIEASQFTVGQFIQDNDWLNNTGIPFFSGLS
ncbi:Putative pectinesterase/pectinesterase inhibitor 40 [Glycine soja]|nr:Putative pectinesterase/pectinesterase inhibitor 40 [Glycine soja]